MADMTPQQIQELLETLNKIAQSLQHISTTLSGANFNHLNSHLSHIAQKTGRG